MSLNNICMPDFGFVSGCGNGVSLEGAGTLVKFSIVILLVTVAVIFLILKYGRKRK